MFLIPNADVFLIDAIKNSDFEKGKKYSFGEFIQKLTPCCDIVFDLVNGNKNINYGVSCGLRTLHDQEIITMEHILDQMDIWSLYPLKAHPISSTVTNITINV